MTVDDVTVLVADPDDDGVWQASFAATDATVAADSTLVVRSYGSPTDGVRTYTWTDQHIPVQDILDS